MVGIKSKSQTNQDKVKPSNPGAIAPGFFYHPISAKLLHRSPPFRKEPKHMNYQLEVCIDNIESLQYALAGGATRIELCSSLDLGGLTPSFGFMRLASNLSSAPIYAMIRPRQGDFLYVPSEIEQMMWDIESAAKAGLTGVVLGVLTEDSDVNKHALKILVDYAHSLSLNVTFHRAIDVCRDYRQAMETIIELGCERVLTSGQASSAEKGIATIKEMVTIANGRIAIMAGAGVNAGNVRAIIEQTGVQEVHMSGKTSRPSKMKPTKQEAYMGNEECDDSLIPITSTAAVEAVAHLLR